MKNKKENLELLLESRKSTMRNDNIDTIKKDFLEIDIDNSGYIDIKELHKGLTRYGINLSLKKTKKLLKKYDDNPDGKIELGEFMQLKNDIDSKKFRKSKFRFKKSRHKKSKTQKRKNKNSKPKHKKTYRKLP